MELNDEQEEQFEREREAAPEARILNDEDFDAYANSSKYVIMMLSEADRTAFHSTAKWHQGQRMAIHNLGGITVGGKSLEEIAKLKASKG